MKITPKKTRCNVSLYLSVNRVPYLHSAAGDMFFVLLFDGTRSTNYL